MEQGRVPGSSGVWDTSYEYSETGIIILNVSIALVLRTTPAAGTRLHTLVVGGSGLHTPTHPAGASTSKLPSDDIGIDGRG